MHVPAICTPYVWISTGSHFRPPPSPPPSCSVLRRNLKLGIYIRSIKQESYSHVPAPCVRSSVCLDRRATAPMSPRRLRTRAPSPSTAPRNRLKSNISHYGHHPPSVCRACAWMRVMTRWRSSGGEPCLVRDRRAGSVVRCMRGGAQAMDLRFGHLRRIKGRGRPARPRPPGAGFQFNVT